LNLYEQGRGRYLKKRKEKKVFRKDHRRRKTRHQKKEDRLGGECGPVDGGKKQRRGTNGKQGLTYNGALKPEAIPTAATRRPPRERAKERQCKGKKMTKKTRNLVAKRKKVRVGERITTLPRKHGVVQGGGTTKGGRKIGPLKKMSPRQENQACLKPGRAAKAPIRG